MNESGVTIDTIAIGQDASPQLERLSNSTGGQAYNHDERSNSLADAFSKSATTEKCKEITLCNNNKNNNNNKFGYFFRTQTTMSTDLH